MAISTIQYSSAAHDGIIVTTDSGEIYTAPWPVTTWHAELINNWLSIGNTISDAAEETPEAVEAQTRADKEEQIKALALGRIGLRVAALADFDTLDLIVTLVQEGALNTPAPGGDMAACRDIYVYAKARIIDARNLPIATVEAYDPAADGNFPS